MKLPQRPASNKKWLGLAILLIAVVAAAGAYWYFYVRPTTDNSIVPPRGVNEVDYSPATEQEKQESEAVKSQTKPADQPPTPQPTAPPLGLTIIRAGTIGQAVQIRTQVDGATTGTCQAQLSKTGATTVQKTFQIVFQATSSSCNGDIPVGEFNASGDWDLSVVATSGNKASAPVTQKVKVDK